MDSLPPDIFDWAFWFKDSASVRDLLVSLGAVIGLPLLIWREVTGHRAANIAAERHQKQTDADRERRITDSFTKAVELLGKPELEVRLGAIYTLERIAHESERDHWPIMETLTAYVRTKAPRAFQSNQSYSSDASAYAMVVAEGTIKAAKERVRYSPKGVEVDIQAVLTVLSRRNVRYEYNKDEGESIWETWQEYRSRWHEYRFRTLYFIRRLLRLRANSWARGWIFPKQCINLANTDLSFADLSDANLIRANLTGANLTGADLSGAKLRNATLCSANLTEAVLYEAYLSGAYLDMVNLSGAQLTGANLSGANLHNSNLSGSSLDNADLSGSSLDNADLSGANLTRANLSGSSQVGAKFCQTIMPDGSLNNRDCSPKPALLEPSKTPPAPN